jgi:hypothetical protein
LESSGTASTRTQVTSMAPGQWLLAVPRFSNVLGRFSEQGEHLLGNAHVGIEIPFAGFSSVVDLAHVVCCGKHSLWRAESLALTKRRPLSSSPHRLQITSNRLSTEYLALIFEMSMYFGDRRSAAPL